MAVAVRNQFAEDASRISDDPMEEEGIEVMSSEEGIEVMSSEEGIEVKSSCSSLSYAHR